jgi:solute carrier family 25 phosphate transporter 3
LQRRKRSVVSFATSLDSIGSSNNGSSQNNNNNNNSTKVTSWKSVLIQKKSPAVATHEPMTRYDKILLIATTLGAIVAYAGLIVASGVGAWRFYLAGGICSATSHAIPVPIDVVKTRMQVDPKLAGKSLVEATRLMVEQEGAQSLLAGLGPTTWGYLAEGSMKWGSYEVLKPAVSSMLVTMSTSAGFLGFLNSQIITFVICGVVSGFVAAAMVCPMEALRIRLVSEPNFAPQGWIQGGIKMLQQEGVPALWKGILPMIYKQVPYTVTKNVSFDLTTKYAYMFLISQGIAMTSATKITVPLIAAVLASILSCISSQPGDMLLSLVNAHEGGRRTNDIMKDILRSERGFRGFFVGMKTRFLHVGIIVTLQLFIYDFVKRLCGIAATGTV